MELTKVEKARRYDFIVRFANEIKGHYDEYNWDDECLQSFIKEHGIQCLFYQYNGSHNVSQYCKFQYSKDKVYDLLRHIRNAMAHGHVKEENGNIILKDYSQKGTSTLEMSISLNIFWKFVAVLENSRKK